MDEQPIDHEAIVHDKNQTASEWYWRDGRLFIRVSQQKSLRYGSRLANEQEEALIREVERLRERIAALESAEVKKKRTLHEIATEHGIDMSKVKDQESFDTITGKPMGQE